MKLMDVGYDTLPSNPNSQRWYNTGQWARNAIVDERLLRDNSPRGVSPIFATMLQRLPPPTSSHLLERAAGTPWLHQ